MSRWFWRFFFFLHNFLDRKNIFSKLIIWNYTSHLISKERSNNNDITLETENSRKGQGIAEMTGVKEEKHEDRKYNLRSPAPNQGTGSQTFRINGNILLNITRKLNKSCRGSASDRVHDRWCAKKDGGELERGCTAKSGAGGVHELINGTPLHSELWHTSQQI